MAISRNKILALTAAIAMILVACNHSSERGIYHRVDQQGWLYSDTLVLQPSLNPAMLQAGGTRLNVPNTLRDIVVVVRHTNAYAFNNIWIELTYSLPDTLRVDTFDVRLADDIGRWYGTGIGVGYQRADTVLKQIPLREDTPVLLRHVMRADTLPNIEQVGIVVL